jgi:hypothetical protein
MPLHDYVKQIYEEVDNPAYFIRLLDYSISKRSKRPSFSIANQTAVALITGVLENTQTKEHYNSLTEFYNKVNMNVRSNDIEILKYINVTSLYTVWRIICSITEQELFEFCDQKYRMYLLSRNIKERIKQFTFLYTGKNNIDLLWNGRNYVIQSHRIICLNDMSINVVYQLLDAFENNTLDGLYYVTENKQYLISNK